MKPHANSNLLILLAIMLMWKHAPLRVEVTYLTCETNSETRKLLKREKLSTRQTTVDE